MTFANEVTMQAKTLFVSAGHSDSDPGAMSQGFSEAALVLKLRDSVVTELKDRGIEVTTDGAKGENLPLPEAMRMAETHDVAVEFHFNSFHRDTAHGTEVLSDAEGKAFANRLSKAVSKAIGTSNRGAKAENSGQHSRLGFIRSGGSILEVAFISSPKDIERYDKNYQEVVGSICDVLEDEVVGGYA